jgi:hypothetical protein
VNFKNNNNNKKIISKLKFKISKDKMSNYKTNCHKSWKNINNNNNYHKMKYPNYYKVLKNINNKYKIVNSNSKIINNNSKIDYN